MNPILKKPFTHWNPQLLRELKGRLKPRNIIIAVVISILAQVLIFGVMASTLPRTFSSLDLSIDIYPELEFSYEHQYDENGERPSFGTVDRVFAPVPIEPNSAYPDFSDFDQVIRPGDRILKFDNVPLDSSASSARSAYQHLIRSKFSQFLSSSTEDVRNSLRSIVPGQTITLTLERFDADIVEVEVPLIVVSDIRNDYCPKEQPSSAMLPEPYPPCTLIPGTDTYAIDWQGWYLDAFLWLSGAMTFPLLTIGCFWLIGNLEQEEKRGTLNFVRLSPQSAWTILGGKMLGVPSLLYLAVGLIVPAHTFIGLAGKVPLVHILSFDVIVCLSCLLFFSSALLFGMVCRDLGGFQAWLGGGLALLLQIIMFRIMEYSYAAEDLFSQWIPLFSPLAVWEVLPLAKITGDYRSTEPGTWYGLIVSGGAIAIIFMILNSGVWSAWVWRSLRRRFYAPTATLLSKQESYWLTLCFQVMMIGFVWNLPTFMPDQYPSTLKQWQEDNLTIMVWLNLVFLALMVVALTPQRQTLYDWVRYRHLKRDGLKRRTLWYDLVSGEDSPALVAIAINGGIMVMAVAGWLLWVQFDDVLEATATLVSGTMLVLLYGSIVQIILSTPWQRRTIWATGAIAGLFLIPPIFLSVPRFASSELWFFTFPWAMEAVHMSLTTMVAAIGGQAICVGLVNLVLTRRLRKAGQSSSKELFAESTSMLVGTAD